MNRRNSDPIVKYEKSLQDFIYRESHRTYHPSLVEMRVLLELRKAEIDVSAVLASIDKFHASHNIHGDRVEPPLELPSELPTIPETVPINLPNEIPTGPLTDPSPPVNPPHYIPPVQP